MPRTKKDVIIEEGQTNAEEMVKADAKEEVKIPSNVEKLMKLYPQYESFYVTSNGFVHPVDAPEYLTKGATLYKNKHYKS